MANSIRVSGGVLEFPFVRAEEFNTTHVEVARLKSDQAEALTFIYRGLLAEGVQMRNGVLVKSRADALRWLLEQASDSILGATVASDPSGASGGQGD